MAGACGLLASGCTSGAATTELGCSPGGLHILSGFPAGEDPAIAAVFALFAERCPGVSLIDEIPVNQVTQAAQFLDDMANNRPPDLFVFDAGKRSLQISTADPERVNKSETVGS
jgi:hypothetical protein